MQVSAVVYVAVLLLVAGCSADDEEVEADEPVESDSLLAEEEAVGADIARAELVKESRLGAKASPRSRFPAYMVGYNRYYPGYSPEYYRYPANYPSYYPSYPSNPSYYPPMGYPTYPPMYNAPNYYQPNYPPNPSPYDYGAYGTGVNEYSARHERA